MTPTTHTPEQLRADLQRARAARKDALDLPRTMTQREVEAYEAHTAVLDTHIRGIGHELEMIGTLTTRRAPLQTGLDRLRKVEATIDGEIAAATDYTTISDAQERDKEWGRQQLLAASKTALHQGVEYLNGVPLLPGPLGTLLTDTCATCGHQTLAWPGSISALEDQIATLDKQIAEHQWLLNTHVQGAQAALAEPVTTN